MTVTNVWLGGKIYGGEVAAELKEKVDKVAKEIIEFIFLGSFVSSSQSHGLQFKCILEISRKRIWKENCKLITSFVDKLGIYWKQN